MFFLRPELYAKLNLTAGLEERIRFVLAIPHEGNDFCGRGEKVIAFGVDRTHERNRIFAGKRRVIAIGVEFPERVSKLSETCDERGTYDEGMLRGELADVVNGRIASLEQVEKGRFAAYEGLGEQGIRRSEEAKAAVDVERGGLKILDEPLLVRGKLEGRKVGNGLNELLTD